LGEGPPRSNCDKFDGLANRLEHVTKQHSQTREAGLRAFANAYLPPVSPCC
jgi:hypothetical protein